MNAPRGKLGGRLVRAIADSGQRQALYQFPWEDDAASERAIRLRLRPARRVEIHVVDGAGNAVKNATYGVFGNYNSLKTGKTDGSGHAVFFVPREVRVEYVFAFRDGRGLDYRAYVLPRGHSGDQNATAPELPHGPIKLTLDGAKPLRVRVTERDGRPIAGIRLNPWLLKKPDQPGGLNLSYFNDLLQAKTDATGWGKFDIRGPQQNAVEKFEITSELEREFNFHADRPEKGILRGTVVTGDPPQPVAGAELAGIYRYALAGLGMKATTDKSGTFEVERLLHRTVIHARSKDGTLAGVVQVEPDDRSVTIPIRPVATATGRLIDATTGKPLPEREIVYGVHVPIGDDDAPFLTSFGGKTTTDAEGRLELSGLILGQEYDIRVTIRNAENPEDVSWRRVGKVNADRAKEINLGDLKLKPAYRPPTVRDRIATAFDAKESPVERFEAARRDATIGCQRVLILFADPDGNATRQFMQLRFEDQEVRRAFDPFRFMAVDSSVGNLSVAKQLATSIAENLDGPRSVFSVFVTDTSGKALASADASPLMHGGQISKDNLLAFLREHTLEPLDARKLLDDALARAKTENKRVIVQETATWCGPCRLLSRFLAKHREKWASDYILVKMDHRWKDAAKIMAALRGGADGGVPWWAILDADAKVLVTSNDSDGKNIGFPSTPSGRAHFRVMLEKTAIRMTADEITALVEALGDNAR